ncbi:MAG: futalosine hydrolase [Bacteroidetes bacterium]|nr:futalosine hydrolase [Bacteroidota bacterium]
MARIVVIFASPLEAQGFKIPPDCTHQVEFLISGVGAYATQYSLHEYCVRNSPDIIINAGIAGSFSENYEIGQVLSVNRDCFADVGVQNETDFQSIFDMNLANPQQAPFVSSWLPIECAQLSHSLPQVSAITVNSITATGTQRNVWLKKYNPAIETMEGAAVHYVALQQNIPCLHLRAISNMVGERNKSKWNIPFALGNLYEELGKVLI